MAMADVKAGVDAWEQGKYDAAVKQWRPAAAAGDADAQFNMGQAYKLGRGVPMDLKAATEWLDRKSVVSGKSVSVRVDLVGRRIIQKKTSTTSTDRATHLTRSTKIRKISY